MRRSSQFPFSLGDSLRRFGGVAPLVVVAILGGSLGYAQPELSWRGRIIDSVTCLEAPAQNYALYLPSHYTPERRWPIVYCFDPVARGRMPVDRLRAAAEKHGYIVVGSNNSHNGPWSVVFAAANAMLADTQRRFSVDPRRMYAAGCSGGARASCAIAEIGKFAGVVACGGGFPGDSLPVEIHFAFFATIGRGDFNFSELHDLEPELERRKVPHRIVVFDGGHNWAPEPLMDEALAWFDLQAMRAATLPRDDGWIRQYLTDRVAAASAIIAANEKATAYHSIVADFDGLADTSEIVHRVSALEQTRDYRKAEAALKRALRDEAKWIKELTDALRDGGRGSKLELATPFVNSPRPEVPAAGDPGDHNAMPDVVSETNWARVTIVARDNPDDPFEAVRRIAADLRQRSAKNPAAARALNGVLVTCMTDGATLFDAGDLAAAGRAFEAATILNPEAGWGYFEWARVRAAAGDRAGARELLQTATAKGFHEPDRIAALRSQIDPLTAPAPNSPPLPVVLPSPVTTIPTPAAFPPLKAAAVGSSLALITSESRAPATTVEPGHDPIAGDPNLLVLPTVRVKAQPMSSFGIGLKVLVAPETRQIARIVIYEVVPDSDAAVKHIAPGDEIMRVDGRSIHSFVAGFSRASEFGRLFVARKQGDQITLELLTSTGELNQVTLTQGGDRRPPWQQMDDLP